MDYSFGYWVKLRRKALDLTQQQLAQRVGCSHSAIFKIEADERRPSLQIAELLARHLEIPSEQQAQFLKVARQEKSADGLGPIPQIPPGEGRAKPNLPVPPTALIGRETEIHMLIEQLRNPECRLLTLTGSGGVGKTRLAIEAAHRLQTGFQQGVYFVPLVGTSSAEFIVPAIADAVGFPLSGVSALKLQLFHFLENKRILLVLDNLEHLLDDIDVLSELLACTTGLKILATSREPLGLQGEWVFGVQGLPVPTNLSLGNVASNSAVTLFLQRARQLERDFTLQVDDLPALERICYLVDGLPLGIELAAGWVRMIPCREIAQEIEKNIDFLTAHVRDIPERHRSMRAVFDYSWDLLTEAERQVLMRLAVFRGGFTRKAAEQVAGADLRTLSSLVDKSLVRRDTAQRFDLHELIRQYAHYHLQESGQLEIICGQHLSFFLTMAEESCEKLRGPEQLTWLNELDQEHDNLRAALSWSLRPENSNEDMIQASLQFAGALQPFWKMRNHWSEGRTWLQRALAQPVRPSVTPERIRALTAAALLAAEQADLVHAAELASQNLALAQELGDLTLIAMAFHACGVVFWKQKDFPAAQRHCEQASEYFRSLGDRYNLAGSLQVLGRTAISQHRLDMAGGYLGECANLYSEFKSAIEHNAVLSDLGLLAYLNKEFDTARKHHEISLEFFKTAGNIAGIEMSLNRLGDLARCENDYESAGRLYQESFDIYHETGDRDEIASLLHNLGYVALARGETAKALEYFKSGLALQRGLDNQAGIAECILGIACVLMANGQVEPAARFFGAAETLREAVGAVLWPANQHEYERYGSLLGNSLEGLRRREIWAEGKLLPLEQVLTEVDVL